jgi:hypothetical protein
MVSGHAADLGTRNPASIMGNIHDDSLFTAFQTTPTARLHGSGQTCS